MGVHNLWPLLSASGHTTSLEYYSSKKLAIDTSIWLHQYAFVTVGPEVSTSLLFGLFCRILKMKYYGIKPVFIFDGKTPALKQKCLERRRKKWNDEKRMKGALKKLIMREKLKAKIEQRLNGTNVNKNDKEIEQERKELAGELNFNINALDSSQISTVSLDTSMDISMDLDDPFQPSQSSQIDTISVNENDDQDDEIEIVKITSKITNDNLVKQNIRKDKNDDVEFITSKRIENDEKIKNIEDNVIDFNFRPESNIIVENSDLDPEVFLQLPESVQKEILEELESRVNYRYRGGSAKLTNTQGGGIDNFSGNQIDFIVRSNIAGRSLKKIKEKENEIQTGVQTNNIPSSATIWSGKDAYGESIEIVDTSQSSISKNMSENDIRSSFTIENISQEKIIDLSQEEMIDMNTSNISNAQEIEGGFLLDDEVEDESNLYQDNIPSTDEKESEEDEWEEATPILDQSPIENQEPEIDAFTIEQLKKLDIDIDVFISLPKDIKKEIVSSFPDLNISPIFPTFKAQDSNNLQINQESDEWEDINIEETETVNNIVIHPTTLTNQEIELSRVLFPSTMFNMNNSLEDFAKNINKQETELESGVTAVNIHEISTTTVTESPSQSSLSRSFEIENIELKRAYAQENPGYTPDRIPQKDDGFSPSIYDETPNTFFNSPEYQRRINLSSTRREGSLAVYNEHRELINKLFKFMGVPYIQSPYEADAQCGFLSLKGMIDGIISDDSDIFIFGGSRILKFAFSNSGEKHVEEYTMESISKHLGLSRNDLIAMAMLLGCDYTEGVHNVGPVTAVEVIEAFKPTEEEAEGMSDEDYILTILKEFSNWANLMTTYKPKTILTRKDRFMKKYFNLKKRAVFPSGFPDRMIVRAYLSPQVDTSEERIEWGDFQLTTEFYEFAKQYLGLDFETANKYIDPVLQKQKEREQQTSIMSYVERTRISNINSKRVRYAVSQLKKLKRKRDELEEIEEDNEIVNQKESELKIENKKEPESKDNIETEKEVKYKPSTRKRKRARKEFNNEKENI